MKNKKEFQNLYNINPETNAYTIEVSLDDYSELFNGWDASPLRKKDLEPELLDYLEQAGYEIPIKEKVEMCFFLQKSKKDLDKENRSIVGVKNNFKVQLFFINKTLQKYYRQTLTYMFLSISFLFIAYSLGSSDIISFSLIREALFIGGWFLTWEAFSLFFFTAHDEKIKRKVYERFLNSEVYFKDVE